jgi:phage/plasmid primase-like uncharacterized protein
MILPIFAPGEVAARPKDFTDFNDLANRSALGVEGVDRQLRPIVIAAIDRHKLELVREQEHVVREGHRKSTKIS